MTTSPATHSANQSNFRNTHFYSAPRVKLCPGMPMLSPSRERAKKWTGALLGWFRQRVIRPVETVKILKRQNDHIVAATSQPPSANVVVIGSDNMQCEEQRLSRSHKQPARAITGCADTRIKPLAQSYTRDVTIMTVHHRLRRCTVFANRQPSFQHQPDITMLLAPIFRQHS